MISTTYSLIKLVAAAYPLASFVTFIQSIGFENAYGEKNTLNLD
jgi:hypothetical protein